MPIQRPATGTGQAPNTAPAALQGMTVFERGWLSSNNVLFHGHAGCANVLVDSGHCLHAEQTIALVRAALDGAPLDDIVNTHLHSDHCGGNAALQRVFGAPVSVPSGSWQAVADWDDAALTFSDVAQRIERFEARHRIDAGSPLELGDRSWQVIAAPGHDPDAVMLFEPQHGVLISGDALWQDGFGVVFPELDGEPGFDDVATVLDQIAGLPVRWVIPGHGSPFNEVDTALERARSRLAAYRADPPKHARYAAKVLLKYHLMEEQTQSIDELHRWADSAPMFGRIWQRIDRPAGNQAAWIDWLVAELARSGAVSLHGDVVHNR